MLKSANTIDFQCICNKRFRARFDQGGRAYTCPDCGAIVRVPRVALNTEPQPPRPPLDVQSTVSTPTRPVTLKQFLQPPKSFGHLLAYLMAGWLACSLVTLVISFFSPIIKYISLLLFLCVTAATVQQIWQLLRARQRVLVEKDVPLLWGLVRLIAWDPIEGVLVLQNKSVGFSDDDLHDGKGGVRFLYPVLGEELALRVPLEVQTLRFADENVLTQEYLSVTIRGTMKWRIVDIRKFYLLVSRELRSTTDAGGRVRTSASGKPTPSGDADAQCTIVQLLDASIEWLRVLAEEQTRKVVSRAKSGLLIADHLATSLSQSGAIPSGAPQDPQYLPVRSAGSDWGGATDGLSSAIHNTIAERVQEYGIAVDDVSLQEIKLPESILAQCIEACKTYYLPLMAQRNASTKRAELQLEVDLLGRDVVGTRDIVGNAPAYALGDFLSEFVKKRLSPESGLAATAAVALAGQVQQQLQPPSTAAALPN